jgi:hypothetical protein
MAEPEFGTETLLRRSAERYQIAGRHIASMLDRRLSEPLPAETGPVIESAMIVACYTDNALDSVAPAKPDNYQAVLERSSGFLFSEIGFAQVPDIYQHCTSEAWHVRDYLRAHDGEGRESLQKDFGLYHMLNKELREAREPRLYAALTRLEGKVAMRNILDLLPATTRYDPRNSETLAWFLRLGQLGNTYDSIADSSTDVRTGRARAGSPLRLRLSLGNAAIHDIGPVLRGMSAHEWLLEAKDVIGVLRGTTK